MNQLAFFVVFCFILNAVIAQNVTLSSVDSAKEREDKIRQEGFLAGLRQSQENIAKDAQAKKEAAAILNSQLPAVKSDPIATHDPLVPLGSSEPVAQMRSADDDILAAFTSFLQPKIFNQNQVKANAPTQTPLAATQTPLQQFPQAAPQQMLPIQDQLQVPQRLMPIQGQDFSQIAPGQYGGVQQPYQALDPRMMGIPNAGIPSQGALGAPGQLGGWPQQQF